MTRWLETITLHTLPERRETPLGRLLIEFLDDFGFTSHSVWVGANGAEGQTEVR